MFAVYLSDSLVSSIAGIAGDRYLLLSHPLSSHAVALTEFGESGFERTLTGFLGSDGRTISGAIKIIGGGYLPKQQWQIKECIVNNTQLKLFESLLALQSSSKIGMVLWDSWDLYQLIPNSTIPPTWLSGSPVTNELGYSEGYTAWNVFVDVDEGFKKFIGNKRNLLQFVANAR